MLYLLYSKDGKIRKFPLDRPVVGIGRGSKNDIVLKTPVVSKEHCRIEIDPDGAVLRDLDSRNGTFVNGKRIDRHRLRVNDSFCIEDFCFFLKEGELEEARLSRELADIIFLPRAAGHRPAGELETEESRTKFDLMIAQIAKASVTSGNFSDFLHRIRDLTRDVISRGSLGVSHSGRLFPVFNHLRLRRGEWKEAPPGESRSLGRRIIESKSSEKSGGLLYVWDGSHSPPSPAFLAFLSQFLEVVEFHLNLVPSLTFAIKQDHVLYEGRDFAVVADSPAVKDLVQSIRKIARTDSPTLILGESGTGKELFARMIYELSGRRNLVAINCAAIPVGLLESELFGYEKGAFTDARTSKTGKLQDASGGILVLDEIGDMPIETQAKILRVIQDKIVTPLGGHRAIPVDVRIIGLTNHDIYRQVRDKAFREDLFFRLRGHELRIPPLRERREDIIPLIRHFTRVYAEKNDVRPGPYSQKASDCLTRYDWPGNIRELENEIKRLMETIEDKETIEIGHILPAIVATYEKAAEAGDGRALNPLKDSLRRKEKDDILRLLMESGGNKKKAAQALGMSYRGFLKKLEKLEID